MDPSDNSVVRAWTTTGSTATSTTISGLTNGMTYVANIVSINAFGPGSSTAASPSFTPSAAPAPAPGPQPSQATTTPAQQIPATPAIPVASPSTSTAVAGVPDNPPVGQVVTPGLRLVSAEVADNAQPRLVKRDLGSTLKTAPIVDAATRAPVSLVTQGLSSNTLYQVRVKVGKTYVDLGGAVTDADGVAQLPVFQSARAGTVTVAIVDPLSGSTTYLKVKFTQGT
jgi:hypothetical protein